MGVGGFSAEELQRVVLAMSCAKAPGHDGWAVGRMRQWPLAVWGCVAELFKVVETFGRWPAALRGGVICLLPNAGVQATTVNPLEARQVCCRSCIGFGLTREGDKLGSG